MNIAPSQLTEFGFWLAVALVVVSIVWAGVRKRQMKHELTLKLLEKGQGMDPALLEKLLASDKSGEPVQPKSPADRRRQERGMGVFLFLMAGVLLTFLGIAMRGHAMVPVDGVAGQGPVPLMRWVDTGPNWPLIGLGAFCFVFGCLLWLGVEKEYRRAKAEEKLSKD